jgi:hypothetical protein
MAKRLENKTIRVALFGAVLGTAAFATPAAFAEDCSRYPEGPARFSCASSKNPGLVHKLERCKQAAEQTGLRSGAKKAATQNYVIA